MSLIPGARLGAYEVVGRLGAGAMGEVYRARDSRLGREVALKVLPEEFASNPDRRRRFEQESRAAGNLNHPNIVTVYDVGEQDGVAYIVSELVEGESLRELIDRGSTPLRKTLEVGAQIADGLAAAHAAGVVHRDLKPENVMLTRDGRPKILDFGLARYQPATPAEGTMTMTQPGMVMGTVGYMSPEQVLGNAAEAPSDIFSLGIMLYEMLTGKSPFPRPTTVETMSAILRDDPVELPATVPSPVQQIVLHCLEKEPARRFQSATDLAFNLRAQAPGSMSGSLAGSVAVRPKVKPPVNWWAVTAAVCGLAAAGFAALLLTRAPGGVNLARYRFTPLATDAEPQHTAVWSPDGKNIAYVRDIAAGEDEVLVRSLSTLVPTVVARINHAHSLFWSPDSTRVYAVNEQGVWSVSRTGGEKQLVVKGNYFAATLSPDGKTMALWLLATESDKPEAKVWISSPPGAPPRKYDPVVFESVGSYTPVYLRFSPDGSQILLSLTRGGGPRLWLLPYPDGKAAKFKAKEILQKQMAGGDIPNVSWMPDSRHFVMSFSHADNPARQLWLVDSRKETMEALTAGENDRENPAVSPDGAKIAFDAADSELDIVEIPLDGSPVKPLLATSRNEFFPAWAPKSSALAYVTDRSGRKEIWLRSMQEGWDRPLVTQSDFPDDETLWLVTPAISPDGQRIAYGRVSNKHVGELWVSPMAGGSPLRIGDAKEYEIGPSWSHDGKWLTYFSTAGGLMKVSVGGSEAAVSLGFSNGCENPAQWSPDDQWIACATGGAVQLISPDGKNHRTIGNRRAYVAWSADGKDIYALGQVEGGKWRLGAIDVTTSKERTISEYAAQTAFASPFNPSFPLGLSAERKSLATTIVNERSDIWMLEGFGRK